MDDATLERRLTKLEEAIDYIGEDIEELKSTQDDIHNLALSVNTLATQVKRIVDDMCSVTSRLASLENKPAQRWDSLIKTLLTVLASGVAGYFINKIIGG